MGDFHEKASAIWQALDEMSEKDPDAYANFIKSQLKQGADLFGGIGDGDSGKSSSDSSSNKQTANKDKVNPVEDMLKKLSGLNLQPPESINCPSKKKDDKKSANSNDEDRATTTLLDKDIGVGGSLVTSIVKVKNEDDEDVQDAGGQIQLLPIQIDNQKKISGPKKKQPLIQEL